MTLVVIGTDCRGSYESNYHAIMTTTAPQLDIIQLIDHVNNCILRYSINMLVVAKM